MSRSRLLACLSCAALVAALAGCSGGSTPSTEPSTSTTSSSPPVSSTRVAALTRLNGAWPLTGEKVSGSLPNRPVYVVKIDNTANSVPQVGLKGADMVVEELVEGGLTRLAAFYYSHTPKLVGPVRSMRASDVGVVKPARAYLAASGAAPKTVRVIAAAGIRTFTEGAPGFFRSIHRPAPYNLMLDLARLTRHPAKGWHPPQAPYLPFATSQAFHGQLKVHSMAVTFSGAHTTMWALRRGNWVRTNSYAQKRDDFRVNNVLILRVREGNAGYLDPAGNPVPETLFWGKGSGLLVHGAHAVRLTWHKRFKKSPIRLTGPAGGKVSVPPGHTFIELVPRTGAKVSLRR